MLLSESLVWALEEYDISGIKIVCEKTKAKEIANSFMEDFTNLWNEAVESVKKEYGDCCSETVPAKIVYKKYGFFIELGQLEMEHTSGDFYECEFGNAAFDKAFKNLKQAYPEIQYDAYVGYPLCDRRCGTIVQYEFSSDGKCSTHEHVGEKLKYVFKQDVFEEEFEDNFREQLEGSEDHKRTFKALYDYREWIGPRKLKKVLEVILESAETWAEDNDEEFDREEFLEFVEKVEAGEDVEDELEEYFY